MSNVQRSLTLMVYGESKVGKSTFAVTAPYPRLMLDVEGGHRFLPINVKYWDPMREEPPVADGTWDTVVVQVRDYDVVMKAFQWLQSGKHQFKSLIIDSISELQVKCMDNIAGTEQMKMQQWGELLRHMGALLRDLRDLTMHPTQPLEAVVLTAMARRGQDDRMHPYLQGQLAVQAPYFYDVLGYIAIETTRIQTQLSCLTRHVVCTWNVRMKLRLENAYKVVLVRLLNNKTLALSVCST